MLSALLLTALSVVGAAPRGAGPRGFALADNVPLLTAADLSLGVHHLRHAEVFSGRTTACGRAVLMGVDAVQGRGPEGGGYYVGPSLKPPESPVNYDLALFGHSLLKPPRPASYCSGATYAAFVEALNVLFPEGKDRLSAGRLEALRMQERDGSTRPDFVKVWGNWNSQWGHELALVFLTGMGEPVRPADSAPGDFVNIAWKKGRGHAAIFLGWAERKGALHMLVWSSQRETRGYGDRLVPLSKIREAHFVRLTHPERVFTFDAKSEK